MKNGRISILLPLTFVAGALCSWGQIHSVAAMATWAAAQTNFTSVRKLESGELSSDSWRAMAGMRARKPLSAVVLTNDVWQTPIVGVVDVINARHGIDRYWDGYCGFGAWLGREYIGAGALVSVSFCWDQRPKRTVVSFHGTNASVAATWGR